MSAIKCKQCGHENDLTRVFCQNCGTRLERAEGSAGPTISGPTRVPTGPRKLRQGMNLGAALSKLIRAIISTAIVAALIALLIQMSREPEGLPPAPAANDAAAAQIYQGLVAMAENPYGRGMDVTQDQINNYLAARIVGGPVPEGTTVRAQFQRAFVVLKEGEASFYIEQKFLGVPVFMYLDAVPVQGASALSFQTTGGGVGHVRFAPGLTFLLEKVILPVISSVSDATATLQTASVTITPGVAKITWPGKKPVGN